MQEWDKLKIEELNRKQHAYLEKNLYSDFASVAAGLQELLQHPSFPLDHPHLQFPVAESKVRWSGSSRGLDPSTCGFDLSDLSG